MKKYVTIIQIMSILFILVATQLWAGTINISLSGTDPLSVIVRGVSSNQQAANINLWVYYRDDGVTDLAIGNVNSDATEVTFGWGTGYYSKALETGSWVRGGHTFTRRVAYSNANIPGPYDDYWTTGGIAVLILDFSPAGSGHAYVEAQGSDAFVDWSGVPHTITYTNRDVTLPVELSAFSAVADQGQVLLKWATESEQGSLGFNIFRAEDKNGAYEKVNATIIRSAGNSTIHREYQYRDERNLEAQKTYYYKLQDVDVNGGNRMSDPIEVFVDRVQAPNNFYMNQNYPNPFNPITNIKYGLPEAAYVRIDIYNLRGELVAILQDGMKEAGNFLLTWDGRNLNEQLVPSGVYIYRIKAGNYTDTRKMIFTK